MTIAEPLLLGSVNKFHNSLELNTSTTIRSTALKIIGGNYEDRP